jgi:hypothetical protein
MPLVCGDRALADQVTSGGERLMPFAPCWSSENSAVDRHRIAAAKLRSDAATHRAQARILLSDIAACDGLPEAEVNHSLLDHREDIASVVAELDEGRLVGARVRFRRVLGLTADWMKQSLACHHARAALVGFDESYLPHSPAVVAGAETTVLEEDDGFVVLVNGKDTATALIIYARAEALLDPAPPDGD